MVTPDGDGPLGLDSPEVDEAGGSDVALGEIQSAGAEVVLATGAPGLLSRRTRPKKRAHAARSSRSRWARGAILGAVAVVGIGLWAGIARVNAPLRQLTTAATTDAAMLVPGAAPVLPWPSQGQGAIAVPALGVAEQSGPEASVPIASLTKITTALVILRDHPLAPGEDGPMITITPLDMAEYNFEVHHDESSVPIYLGETLSERQLLEAMLIVSANDAAFALAVWDAGTVRDFVVKMNSLAASLDMTGTSYADASGYDTHTVSTAADVLRASAAGMAIPSFAEIVAMQTTTFPSVGTLHNRVPEVGVNGVIGIKSGYTSKAGACMVLAANRMVSGRSVLVIVAVLGQPTPPPILPTTTTTTRPRSTPTTTPPTPPGAATATTSGPTTTTEPRRSGPTTTTTSIPYDELVIADPYKFTRPVVESLLQSAKAGLVDAEVAAAHQQVGTVASTWGGRSHPVPVVTSTAAHLPGWPGTAVHSMVRYRTVAPGSKAGTVAGTVLYAIGSEFQGVPIVLSDTVAEPNWWWRLVHGS